MVLTLFNFILLAVSVNAEILKPDVLATLKPLNAENVLPNVESKKDKLVYFWATWCPDCKSKLTTVFNDPEIYQKYDVYLVATDKDLEKIKHFQKKNNIQPYIAIDADKTLQKELKVFSVPTIVKLSGNNLEVRYNQTGGNISAITGD